MTLLDDAEDLLAVLVAWTDEEGDSRGDAGDTVLKLVRKKLNKAHTGIDRQESRHRTTSWPSTTWAAVIRKP